MNTIVPIAIASFLLGAASALSAASRPEALPRGRPNILVVMADDMGYSDLGSYGGEIRTPAIDRLADNGLRFRQFYTTAKCGPTRTALMSGLYHSRAGIGIRRGKTIGEILQPAGYATAVSGKWHLNGNPVDRGFDDFFGILAGAANHFNTYAGGRLYRGSERLSAEDVPGDFYSTDGFADFALNFMEDAVEREQPFFVYLAFTAPHSPIQAREEDIERYRGKYREKGWDRLRRERFARQQEMGLAEPGWALPRRPFDVPAWENLSPDLRDIEGARMAAYAAMVDRIDQNVGRIMDRLRNWGVAENTLVLFCSDNGASPFDRTPAAHRDGTPHPGARNSQWRMGVAWSSMSNTPYRFYKQNQSNGGILAPLVVSWPNAIPERRGGAIIDTPVHVIDFLPTFAELAKVDYSAGFPAAPEIDGLSLAPLLAGGESLPRERLYFEFADEEFALVNDSWKIVSVNRSPWKLYDMSEDRTETRDLARAKPDLTRTLSNDLNQWIADVLSVDRRFAGTEPDTSRYDDWELYENPRTGQRYSGPNGAPPGWELGAIGDVSTYSLKETGGSARGKDSGGFTIVCDGKRIGGKSDDFVFLRDPDVDNEEILFKLDGIKGGGAHARAGVMFRRNLDADAPFVLAEVNRNGPGNPPAMNLRIRKATGESAHLIDGPRVTWPVWIRIVREDRQISAQYSTDGLRYSEYAQTELPTQGPYSGGIAVNAQKTDDTAAFSMHDILFGTDHGVR